MDRISVEVTGPDKPHCFQVRFVVFSPPSFGDKSGYVPVEINLHATQLVDLIHKASVALSQWQAQTTQQLLQKLTGKSEAELREAGMIV